MLRLMLGLTKDNNALGGRGMTGRKPGPVASGRQGDESTKVNA